MKKIKTIFIVIISSLSLILTVNAATIYITSTTSTLGTFWDNVNSSLTNLNNAISGSITSLFGVSTSTINLIAGTDITLASSTNSITIGNTYASSTWLKVANNGSDINSTSTFRSNLNLGDAALTASSTYCKVALNLSDLTATSTARTNLGLTDTAITASSTWFKVTNNLSEGTAATMRTNLGLGSIALKATTDYIATSTTATSTWVLTSNGSIWGAAAPTGGGTPGGSDTQIQFNNAGAFGGDANFTWASSTKLLTVGDGIDGNIKSSVYYDIADTSWYLNPNNTGTALNVAGIGKFYGTGNNSFVGNVGIGTSTPAYTLDINGSVRIASSTGLTFSDNTVQKTAAINHDYFIIENPTATEDDAFIVFNATSTITRVYAVNKTNGDTATFNLLHNASRSSATSTTSKVFTADQVVTATTTPACFASATTTACATGTFGATASTTVGGGSVMRFFTSAASSTQFNFTVYYTTP